MGNIFKSIGKGISKIAKTALPLAANLLPGPWGTVASAVLGGMGGGGSSGGEGSPAAGYAGAQLTPEQAALQKQVAEQYSQWLTNPQQLQAPVVNYPQVSLGDELSYSEAPAQQQWNAYQPVTQQKAAPQVAAPAPVVQTPVSPAVTTNTPKPGVPQYLANFRQAMTGKAPLTGAGSIPAAQPGNKVMPAQYTGQATPQTQQAQVVPNQPGNRVVIPKVYVPGRTYGNEGGWEAINAPSYAGYREQDAADPRFRVSDQTERINQVAADLQTPEYVKQLNALENASQDKIMTDMNRRVLNEEGYGKEYMDKWGALQMAPLKESYDQALRASNKRAALMNITNTSQPVIDQFGAQPNSVTRNYMKQTGDLGNQMFLMNADEASKNKQYNAEFQERARGAGVDLSGRQNQEAYQTWQGNLNRELSGRELKKAGVELQRTQDAYNADRAWDVTRNNEANRQNWAGYDTDVQKQNLDNKQSWAAFRQGQAENDAANAMKANAVNISLGQWLTDRGDKQASENAKYAWDAQVGNLDNRQKMLANAGNYSQGTQQNADSAWANAQRIRQADRAYKDEQNAAKNESIGNIASTVWSAFNKPKKTAAPKAASPSVGQTIAGIATNPWGTVKGWLGF